MNQRKLRVYLNMNGFDKLTSIQKEEFIKDFKLNNSVVIEWQNLDPKEVQEQYV